MRWKLRSSGDLVDGHRLLEYGDDLTTVPIVQGGGYRLELRRVVDGAVGCHSGANELGSVLKSRLVGVYRRDVTTPVGSRSDSYMVDRLDWTRMDDDQSPESTLEDTPGRGRSPEPERIEPAAPEEFGLVQVWWGDGKGKTTATLGMGMRAAGHGYRVHVLQFMKGGASSVEAVRASTTRSTRCRGSATRTSATTAGTGWPTAATKPTTNDRHGRGSSAPRNCSRPPSRQPSMSRSTSTRLPRTGAHARPRRSAVRRGPRTARRGGRPRVDRRSRTVSNSFSPEATRNRRTSRIGPT